MDGDQPRNLVLVTVDSLRADHCGFIDPESELTPTIDRFASEGVSFTDAIAPGPRTPSSVPVVFTGEFMSDDDDWTMADWQGRQRRIAQHMKRFTHLSERLQRRGYETAAFTANPWTTRESNFDFGFDDFFEISADSDDISSSDLSNSTLFKLADRGFESIPGDPVGWSSKKEWFSQWTGYFHLIQSKLQELSEPFFLWVFILDSHQPYITPRQYRKECSAWEMYYSILRYWYGEISDDEIPPHAREMIGRTYRDAVRSVDAFVESLFEATAEHDPITVFFSDHGEALGEHGSFGHKQTLYEENVRVPFFVHNAGITDEVDGQLPLQALPRLLTDLVDPGEFAPRTYTRPFVVSQTENNRARAVRTERWKLVTDGTTDTLYDLASDPDETTDVHAEYDDVTSSLRAVIRRHDATQAEKERTGRVAEALVTEGRV